MKTRTVSEKDFPLCPSGSSRLALVAGLLLYSWSAWSADTFNGREVYDRNCSICHGADGHGLMMGVPNFSMGEGLMQSDATLFEAIRAGKNTHPSFDGLIPEMEILDVIAYLRTLQR